MYKYRYWRYKKIGALASCKIVTNRQKGKSKLYKMSHRATKKYKDIIIYEDVMKTIPDAGKLFNEIINREDLPKEWKQVKIRSIFEKGDRGKC